MCLQQAVIVIRALFERLMTTACSFSLGLCEICQSVCALLNTSLFGQRCVNPGKQLALRSQADPSGHH